MKLSSLFAQGKFVVTSEVGPPKGTDVSGMLAEAEHLKGVVDAVNVTDNQSAVMRLGSLTASHLLKQKGFEPVFQLTCRDRNRLALQSDLLSAAVLGIENVLCLTGDHVHAGDHPQAKPVYDFDSVQLLRTARELCNGFDAAGNQLDGKPDFCLGAVVNPGADPLEPQLIKLEKKIKAGAQFIQTQAVFDPAVFEKFIKQASSFGVPVVAGIVLLKSAGMGRYMNENVSGVNVPDSLLREMADLPAEKRKEKSAAIAVKLIKELKQMCAGVHIMPLGWTDLVPGIVSAAV
ncbi:methylenetetrahydrofolate reductase [Desulfotomaculum copahuensis]|uniref:Methylenetetrahydrofolate reductase n=1 Tax=Desulfotomaculum copahuensis TaxID=1838280 RepID=A0A1B7LGB9_9FIRM|nr:methylenetetrahydrofolate reductase [Desulfotomaculum copahuensis]OAT85000.1 5,10-methylenetetrahydrofolate reductase [Desulfotomaculum copahuensis]